MHKQMVNAWSVIGHMTVALPEPDSHPYQKKVAKDFSNRQLKSHLCSEHVHGCKKCDCYEKCEYGREWVKRQEPSVTLPKKKKKRKAATATT
jgi:hypothetical protein